MSEYKNRWQRDHRRKFAAERGYSTAADYATGGLRESVLIRDNRQCVRCGMTEQQHREKFQRPITIDHRDKNRKNNTLENLQTLCLICHGKKDLILPLRAPRFDRGRIGELRRLGLTFEGIAERIGCSIATAYKYAKGAKL